MAASHGHPDGGLSPDRPPGGQAVQPPPLARAPHPRARPEMDAPVDIPTVRVIDSHTGGEPTRVVIDGGPDLGRGPIADRLRLFRDEHDAFRAKVIREPRGSDVAVGALLCDPSDRGCAAAVIFFNNAGYLGMCGHGLIGLIVSLAHLGRIGPGGHRIETPVGVIEAELEGSNTVTIANVPSYQHAAGVSVEVPGAGPVRGDVAWGGNWFFLTEKHGQELSLDNADALIRYCRAVRRALKQRGITGADGQEIDHIELCGPPAAGSGAHSRNFVLCPGGAYDRSPCGTGTSAKLACLIADGRVRPGEVYRQQSIVGSVFEAWAEPLGDGGVRPHVRGSAYVHAEATLLFHPRDPFRDGIA